MSPAEWIVNELGITPTPHFRCIPHEINGKLVGAVGYDNWNGNACQIHWLGKQWTPRFLAAIFYYPFIVEDCKVIVAMVPSGNTASAELLPRLGFVKVYSITDGHPDGELHTYLLRRENCKFLKRYYPSLRN